MFGKIALLLLLVVGIRGIRTSYLNAHQIYHQAHASENATSNTNFELQFSKLQGDFDQIKKLTPTQDKSKFVDLTLKLDQYSSSVKELHKVLKEGTVEIVLNIEQCPPKSANQTKIKGAVHNMNKVARQTEDYLKTCKECDFAKPSLSRIENFTKAYGVFVNRTLDRGFCPVTPTIAAPVTPEKQSNQGASKTSTNSTSQTNSNSSQTVAKNQTSLNKTIQTESNASKITEPKQSQSTSNVPKVIAVKCDKDEVFNHTQNKCVKINPFCQKGFVFVKRLKKCVAYEKLCTIDQYYDKEHNACYAKSLKCKSDQRYNRKKHICQKLDLACEGDKVFSKKLQACVTKVVCKPDEELNQVYQICQKKKIVCGKNQIFDYKKRSCVTHQFVTSPYHQNLIYVGRFANYVSYYKTAKKTDKDLLDCPLATPYYQKSSQTCISCPQETPYFDLTNDLCVKCKFNEFFSPFKHKCVNERKVFTAPYSVRRIRI